MQLVNVPLFEFKGLKLYALSSRQQDTKSKDPRPLQCVQSCVKAMNVGIQLQQQDRYTLAFPQPLIWVITKFGHFKEIEAYFDAFCRVLVFTPFVWP